MGSFENTDSCRIKCWVFIIGEGNRSKHDAFIPTIPPAIPPTTVPIIPPNTGNGMSS